MRSSRCKAPEGTRSVSERRVKTLFKAWPSSKIWTSTRGSCWASGLLTQRMNLATWTTRSWWQSRHYSKSSSTQRSTRLTWTSSGKSTCKGRCSTGRSHSFNTWSTYKWSSFAYSTRCGLLALSRKSWSQLSPRRNRSARLALRVLVFSHIN